MRKFSNFKFSTNPTNFYNLEMIIAIGYRVKSNRGIQFRILANTILKEYLVKGYNINVGRFKNNGNVNNDVSNSVNIGSRPDSFKTKEY